MLLLAAWKSPGACWISLSFPSPTKQTHSSWSLGETVFIPVGGQIFSRHMQWTFRSSITRLGWAYMEILSIPVRLCMDTHTISKKLITYGTQDVLANWKTLWCEPRAAHPPHLLQDRYFLLALTDLAQSNRREHGGKGEVKDRWSGRMKGVQGAQSSLTLSYLTMSKIKSTNNWRALDRGRNQWKIKMYLKSPLSPLCC